MQTLDIYRGEDLFVTIKPDNDSTQTKTIMGENVVRLAFTDNRNIKFQINDWCEVFDEKYFIMQIPTVTKLGQFRYRYTVEMMYEGALMARTNFFFMGDDNTLKEPDFSLMGTTEDFMNLLLQNLHRNDTEWKLGEVIPSDYKNITFNGENCYNALARIAEEFETEFHIVGKTIHLAKRSRETGYLFKHGQNLGLREITPQPVEDSSVVTRLYAYGSDKNLPADYRNYSRRLRMPDQDFIEQNVDKYGVIEFTKVFDDIYPHRTGTVTGVDFLNPFTFVDSNMDFNLNDYLLPGVAAKVTFNTGQLSGYTFELRSFNWSQQEFTLLLNKDERLLDIPNENLRPAIGDQYVLVDIFLPQSYIDAAEAELAAQAQALLNVISEPQQKFAVNFDPTYLRRKNIMPAIGDLIWIKDENFEVERKIRVTSTTRKIVNEWELDVELADTLSYGRIDIIVNTQNATTRDVLEIERFLQNNPTLRNAVIGDLLIRQGTLRIHDIPTTASYSGFSELVIEVASGKVFRKV